LANELWAHYHSGFTLYAILRRKSDDQVNIQGTSNFEVWVDGNIGTYDHPMTDNGGDYYSVDFPASIDHTDLVEYRVGVFLQPSGSPAVSDTPIHQGEIYWQDGEEVDLGTINITNQTVSNVYNEEVSIPGVTVIDESLNV